MAPNSEDTIISGLDLEQTKLIVTGENRQKKPATGSHNGGGIWKKVSIGGTTGMVLGASAVLASRNLPVEAETGLRMATQVNDDQTFRQAFDAARAEVGQGGVFKWHGNVYHTYTNQEWSELGEQEMQEFNGKLQQAIDKALQETDAQPSHTDSTASQGAEQHVVAEVVTEDSDNAEVQILGAKDLALNAATVHADDSEVYVVNVEEDAVSVAEAIDTDIMEDDYQAEHPIFDFAQAEELVDMSDNYMPDDSVLA